MLGLPGLRNRWLHNGTSGMHRLLSKGKKKELRLPEGVCRWAATFRTLSDCCWKAIVETPMNSIKYVHTNLVAKDWKSLAQFYIKVFGCKRKPPERNLSGKWLDTLTALKNANVKGIHLQLPGYGQKGGPTLEVFSTQLKKAQVYRR